MLRPEHQRGSRTSASVDARLPPAQAKRSSSRRVTSIPHLLLRVTAAAVLLLVVVLPLTIRIPSPFRLRWIPASGSGYAAATATASVDQQSRERDEAGREDASASAATIIPRLPPPDAADAERVDWVHRHVVFFLHVPKTAGLSFSSTLRTVMRPYQQMHRAVGALAPPRLDLSFMQRSALLRLLTAPDAAEFQELYGPHLLLLGHADVRIAEAIAARDGRHVLFVSMMREPVQRLLSHFCYVSGILTASRQEQQLDSVMQNFGVYASWLRGHVNSTRDAESALSFTRFLTLSAQDALDNWATRAYAGCLPSVLQPTEAEMAAVCSQPQLMLAEAKRRLQSFLFIGLTEQYAASLRLLRYSLHYDPQRYLHAQRLVADGDSAEENVNEDKQSCLARLTADGASLAELEARVREVEALDLELYTFASALFASRIAALPA